jgi:hypothetical protein
MKNFRVFMLVSACAVFGVVTASAAQITFDFGSGANVVNWPTPDSPASGSSTGVTIPNPLLLDGGLLEITGTSGGNSANVYCDAGTNANRCGDATGLSTSTAYGLGVGTTTTGGGRVDPGEALTITVLGANLTVELVGFSVTGFNGVESLQYSLDGGTAVTHNAPPTNVARDSVNGIDLDFANTLTFNVTPQNTGNFSLASLTLNVTQNTVPEPATFGLAGLAIAAIAIARKRFARS